MNPDITNDQLAVWKIALALRMRAADGDKFQDFFADVMAARHGEDFVAIRAHGSLGDKGCDGYTRDDGRVFQCYGALNAKINVSTFTNKMSNDFASAKEKLPTIMKRWTMAHNLEGLPVDVLTHFEAMRMENADFDLRMFGRVSFEEIIFDLPITKIEALVGPAYALKGARDLNAKVLSDLISGIMKTANDPEPPSMDPKKVPADKLEFNRIPWHWRHSITAHMDLTPMVQDYFDRSGDPTVGDQVAKVMNDRYIELRQQGLAPGAILDALLESVVYSADGLPSQPVQMAGTTILAHFFDSCDIFEDKPEKVPA